MRSIHETVDGPAHGCWEMESCCGNSSAALEHADSNWYCIRSCKTDDSHGSKGSEGTAGAKIDEAKQHLNDSGENESHDRRVSEVEP